MADSRKEPSLRLRFGGIAAALAVLLAFGAGPAQAANLELPARVDVTVEQGGSSRFPIDLSAGGAFTCSAQAIVAMDSVYSVDAAGDVASGDPALVSFTGEDQRGGSDNCDVTWDTAPDPHTFTATATAAPDTPLGHYEARIAYTVENAGTGPSGKLSNAGVSVVRIHVIPAPPPIVEQPVALPPAVQLVLGVREAPLRPTFGKTELLTLVKGKVGVRMPGGKARGLSGQIIVPNGTVVDTANGVAKVTVERSANGELDSADTWGGGFSMNQAGDGITSLTLGGGAQTSRAGTARATRVVRKRRLWVNGKGNFKTRGKRASAIVRGTFWLTQETSAGTAVVVRRGAVAVRDFGTRRTTLVTAGHSYLARTRVRLQRPRFTG
jgi:hypothetical protein